MAKLNKNAQKWVRALRSNSFRQSNKVLADGGGFCCLGVACVLAAVDGVIPPAEKNDRGHLVFAGQERYLPMSVQDWLGLTDCQGSFSGEDFSSLAKANDTGITFAEIADIIESQPAGLFETRRKK